MSTHEATRAGAPLLNPLVLALTPEAFMEKRNQLIFEAEAAHAVVQRAVEDIAALDRVWVQVFGQLPFEGGCKAAARHAIGGRKSDRSRVREAIPFAVEQVSGDFTVREVVVAVADLLPAVKDLAPFRSLISTTLKRLAQDGLLALRSQGRGRAPNIYRRLSEVSELPV